MPLLKDIKSIINNKILYFYSTVIVILSIIGLFTVISLFFLLFQKTTKFLKAEYPLYVHPVELCDLTKIDKVSCFVLPCHKDDNGSCTKTYDKVDWLKNNSKVMTLKSINIVPTTRFCAKNTDTITCIFIEGAYNLDKNNEKEILFYELKNTEDNKKNKEDLKNFFENYCEKTNNPWICIIPVYLESEKQ